MSLKSIIQALRALPYTEMKALGQTVSSQLDQQVAAIGGRLPKVVATDLSDVLSSLPTVTNDELDVEQKYLADFFRKKRAITVTTAGGDAGPWTVACNDGIKVSAATLRGAFSEFLDALAAYHALRK